jgi:hypothetical protein
VNGSLSAERVLTGTANQITITDNGANGTVVLSTPQDLHTGAGPTFGTLTTYPNADTTVSLVSKGDNNHSSDIQEWQDHGGAVLARIDAIGGVSAGTYFQLIGTAVSGKPGEMTDPGFWLHTSGLVFETAGAGQRINLNTNNTTRLYLEDAAANFSVTANAPTWHATGNDSHISYSGNNYLGGVTYFRQGSGAESLNAQVDGSGGVDSFFALLGGKVGIHDNAPGEMLDVDGNLNVTGVYKVDDVQVLGARVVDARIDDVINSGDATTDGVIDAIRDALIAHGIIAAA